MFLAKTAIVANGLAPMAQSLMWQYKDVAPQFWADTRRAANSIRDSVVGKGRTTRVFRGIPVKESRPRSYGDEVAAAGRGYHRVSARVREFVDAPWDTTKNAAHAVGIRGARKLGKALGSKFIQRHAYPIGKVAGYGGLGLGAYGVKKLVYDPLKRRLAKSSLAKPAEKIRKARDEVSDFSGGNI
jgi:hypothetical protein